MYEKRQSGLLTRRGFLRTTALAAPAIIAARGGALAQLTAPLQTCGENWQSLVSQSLNEDSPVWAGYNVRIAISPSAFTYAYRCSLRARLQAVSSGANLVLASSWVGYSTTPPDFDVAPTQFSVIVGGTATLTPTLVPGNTYFTSKILPSLLHSGKSLMFSFGITSGDIRRNLSATNFTFYFSASQAANAGNAVMGGTRTSTASRCDIVNLVQQAG